MIPITSFDKFNRPSFDLWFMALSFIVSQRSLDPATKHGCVVVDDSNTILAVGYNSPPRGSIDSEVPLTRPEKYMWMAHAEINAITNAARSGVSLNGCTFYVTGPACAVCFRSILNCGAKRLVCGPIKASCFTDGKSKDEMVKEQMLVNRDFLVEDFTDISSIEELLNSTCKYMFAKISESE